MENQPKRLILLTCCVDPGCARKSEYVVVSDPMVALKRLREQTDDSCNLFGGQRTKMHILTQHEENWQVEASLDLEPFFQATYKKKNFYFDENGIIDDHSRISLELMKKLEDTFPEDLKIVIQLINEDTICRWLQSYHPYWKNPSSTTVTIPVKANHIQDVEDDDYKLQKEWFDYESGV